MVLAEGDLTSATHISGDLYTSPDIYACGTPYMKEAEGFDPASYRRKPLSVALWQGRFGVVGHRKTDPSLREPQSRSHR